MIEPDPPQHVESPSSPSHMLARLLRWLVIVGISVGLGAASAPTLTRVYLERRLTDPRNHVRLDALNRLAAMVAVDRAPADEFIAQLLAQRDRSSGGEQAGVDAIAVWLLKRSSDAVAACNELLPNVTDASFVVAAGWLRRVGKWSVDHQPVDVLVRRERILLAGADATVRVGALRSLLRMGSVAGSVLAEHQEEMLSDSSAQVRAAYLEAVAACRLSEDAVQILTAASADSSGDVRRRAIDLLGFIRPAALLSHDVPTVASQDGGSLTALLAGLRGLDAARTTLLDHVASADPTMRAAAAWALGFDARVSERVDRALIGCLDDADELVALRGAVAIGRRAAVMERTGAAAPVAGVGVIAALKTLVGREGWPARAAALFALGQLGGALDAQDACAEIVRPALVESLRGGDVRVACMAADALGMLHDEAYLDVLWDITDQWHDAPILQLAAARGAMGIDAVRSAPAMLDMCGSDSDEVRALSAWWTARMHDVSASHLFAAVSEGGVPVRGGAAMALALRGEHDMPGGGRLVGWLAARCRPGADEFEPSWRLRADYLCARLMLGDSTARPDFDVYMLNANVGRIGPLLALLQIGDRSVLDRLLGAGADIDLDSLGSDAQFADVLHYYLPDAPGWFWFEDEAVRTLQIERLRLWWGVFGPRVRFDERTTTFAVTKGSIDRAHWLIYPSSPIWHGPPRFENDPTRSFASVQIAEHQTQRP